MSLFKFPTISSGGRFSLILEEGPFPSWDSESGEVVRSAESSTTLGVPGVVGIVQQFLELPLAQEEEFL